MGAAFSSFEVEGICGAMDEKLNCGVKTMVNGTSRKQIAESFGGLTRGNIETNGDLAGIGVRIVKRYMYQPLTPLDTSCVRYTYCHLVGHGYRDAGKLVATPLQSQVSTLIFHFPRTQG